MIKRRDFLIASVATGLSALAGPAFAADKANPDKLRIALLPDENASTIIQNAAKKHAKPAAAVVDPVSGDVQFQTLGK